MRSFLSGYKFSVNSAAEKIAQKTPLGGSLGILLLFPGLLCGLFDQLLCKGCKLFAVIPDFILLLRFDGKAHHFRRNGGSVTLFVIALDLFDGLDGHSIETAFGFKQNSLGGQDHPALLLGADDFYGFPGLQHQLQFPGGVSIFIFAAFFQGRPDCQKQQKQGSRGQNFLPGLHGFIPFLGCIDIFA